MLAWKTPCRCERRGDSRDGATTTDRPSCCEYWMEKFNDTDVGKPECEV